MTPSATATTLEPPKRSTEMVPPAEAVPPAGPTAIELLEREPTVRRIHPAQDMVDGVLWYGRPVEGGLVMINSARQVLRVDQLPAGLALRHADPGPSSVSREAALRWATGGESGSVGRTLDALDQYLTRHAVLPEPRTALWVSAWSVATWCYRAFRVFPYLSIRSAEKRCGKSRLLGLLARVAFNASPVTAHPTEAQLFRTAARTGGVQLFDEVETLRDDRERFDALIAVLNVGFERGGVVTRLERRDGRLVEEPYEVYAPRVLAGIAGLKDTLEDRALPVLMMRKRRAEPVARLGRATEEEAAALRDACALACLTRMAEIARHYEAAPALLEAQGIDDRAVDLWSPLVAVAMTADGEDGSAGLVGAREAAVAAGGASTGGRTGQMLAVARELASHRDADAEGGPTAWRLEALEAVRAERGERLAPAELVAALAGRPGWEGVKTARKLAMVLGPMGIFRRQVREGERRRWCYVLDAERLEELRERYGAGA